MKSLELGAVLHVGLMMEVDSNPISLIKVTCLSGVEFCN